MNHSLIIRFQRLEFTTFLNLYLKFCSSATDLSLYLFTFRESLNCLVGMDSTYVNQPSLSVETFTWMCSLDVENLSEIPVMELLEQHHRQSDR